MTSQKSFKARVRTRMDKTGESYTTARRHLLRKSDAAAPEAPPEPQAEAVVETAESAARPPVESPDHAAVETIQAQRFSDASVRQRTGRGWDEWFALLDAWGATAHRHPEIVDWLIIEHDVPGWWAQSVTVAYEQARGLRAPGQSSDGRFNANASRTVAVPADRLFQAFADESLRQRWLPDVEPKVRTATAPKSFRADWPDGSRIVVGFTSRADFKAQVAVQHEKLPDAAAAGRMKAFWRERLTALKQLLEE